MEKFTKLGLSKGLTDVLKEFKFKEPSEIQEKAIPVALAGKDIIGGSATGSGKTLAFASPIIENLKSDCNIQALILTPTRELAEQVAKSIRDFGKNKKLNVLAIYGGVSIGPQINKMGMADVVVGTPGRILDHINRRTMRLDKVKFLVLDEVDRMLDMGFRRDVEKIIRECPTKRQTMMFSATISADLDYLAKKYTKQPVEIAVESHVDPTKLKQVYYDVPDNQKFSLLVNLLKNEDADLVMVFCNTRRNVDFIAENLIKNGIAAKAIHGRIEQKKRIKILEEFHHKGVGVLVCTDVAARGLDIKGVSHVYNYDSPIESKDYIHRIGRTARAGEEGKAITILASRDYENFRKLLHATEIKIDAKDLPQMERIHISIDTRMNPRNRREGRRGPPRRDSRGPRRDSRSSSRGPRRDSRSRDGPRRTGGSYDRRPSSSDRPRGDGRRSYSRRPDSRGPRRDSRSRDGPRRSDSRDRPRRDSRRSSRPRR